MTEQGGGELTRAEFLAHIGYVREDVAAVKELAEATNGRVRALEIAMAVLQTKGAIYGAAAGAVAAAAMPWVLHLVTGK